jgi:hypothetical protein
VHFDITKLDGDDNHLTGAVFSVQDITNDDDAVTMAVNANGYLSEQDATKAGYNLKYDTVYKVTETTIPAGYSTVAPFYFKITWNAEKLAPIFAYVDESGDAVTGPAEITMTQDGDANDIPSFIGHFEVVNHAKSIFPLTGGKGVDSVYLTAIVVIALAGIGFIARKWLFKS